MLYGHLETLEERVDHLLLCACARRSAAYSPSSRLIQVGPTKLVPRQTPPTDDLRTIAASRLLLDNFPHVEAYWVMIGEETASLALHFGASDVNGTLEDEKIAHMALAESPAGLAREQILRMIRDAGKIAVERDALYNVVRYGAEPARRDPRQARRAAPRPRGRALAAYEARCWRGRPRPGGAFRAIPARQVTSSSTAIPIHQCLCPDCQFAPSTAAGSSGTWT